jgi:hypothetical protein
LHVSGRSHEFIAARHTTPAASGASAGHCAPLPEHSSGASQPSAGHASVKPSHCSATSQPPAIAARHCTPFGAGSLLRH